jgi:cytochrome c
LTVFPDGRGLPVGKGTAVRGEAVYKEKCAVCHNDRGEGREQQWPALVGGIGSLATPKPKKTVGSYWPYATTVWDYINRSMPFDHPRTLATDDVYAVTAFVLYLNGIVEQGKELNEKTLPQVLMPNRNGFVPDRRPDVKAKR